MRELRSLAVCTLFLAFLAGCSLFPGPVSPASGALSVSASPSLSCGTPASAPLPSPPATALGEPPLAGEAVSAPQFLSAEQQALYQRAHAIFPAFCGVPDAVDSFPHDGGPPVGEPIYVQIDGVGYYRAQGRYQAWSDFEAMMLSLFTRGYYEQLIGGRGGTRPFLQQGGILYYIDGAAGSILGYRPDLAPDEFELTAQTPNSITFNLIGHYFWDLDENGDPIASVPDTISYPITLVLTENGWRFSQFCIASQGAIE